PRAAVNSATRFSSFSILAAWSSADEDLVLPGLDARRVALRRFTLRDTNGHAHEGQGCSAQAVTSFGVVITLPDRDRLVVTSGAHEAAAVRLREPAVDRRGARRPRAARRRGEGARGWSGPRAAAE